ncbi:ATP-dependent zinc metalloprotease FtsH 4 [Terrisporobacter petrolearius]|uniref:ATP-dependent zinc metalloprotease FtsH n=2 Tax=Terrisporobacter TaxID=1505652 RepID=A0ABZ3FL26_9FIRM|nr:ATP-dependent zinc metalloprotease FtsH [Terrisporobacter sp.]MBN9648364.1 ATP-dependent zinc metalloprotease FtsH [Terrisporobacter glycolicus]UPA30256.1 ATP-dependent zinc metalloprotease FtsH [Terrisporobacter glycolicus]SFJ62399.1 cell division protease FtsH [Terrisporobacter glycolicus]
MNIINNFLKKINNPVPVFAQTKLEKENCTEDHSSSKPKTTFRDVAGLDEVKEELFEVVDFMKSPDKYIKMGAKIPKGILFYGPPGTGKTLLASAVAGETDSSFFNVTGSEFVEKYVGVGAKRVRTLFEKARKEAPSIIFIDEIDAIGARRHSESNNEKDQTLNQLLVEMDGFNKDDNIIIVGATNRLDLLDEALLRPGRFDRHIRINSPNYNSRYEILKVHTNNKPLHKDVDLKLLARKTHGFNGAHLANIANEAAIFAVRDNSSEISNYHFDKAIERVIAGIEQKNSVLIEKEKKIVSYHEAGHALVSNIVNICPIQKISIVPRGEALGYVLQLPDEDRYIYTKEELIGKIKILLAGKAAEEIIFNHLSTGAKDDLKKVTDIADQMVCEYGMSKLGFMTIEGNSKSFMSQQVQKEANQIVEQCYKETLKLLKENINDLHIVANHLYDKETMTLEELQSLIQKEPC